MMPTLDTCPLNNKQALKIHDVCGFTLIEVMVVLMLLALVAGVAFPRLERVYDSIRMSYQKDEVFAQIAGLGYRAYQSGTQFQLGAPDSEGIAAAPLSLPEGWHIETESPVVYRSDGVCLGGEVVLRYGETALAVDLPPPYCPPRVRP